MTVDLLTLAVLCVGLAGAAGLGWSYNRSAAAAWLPDDEGDHPLRGTAFNDDDNFSDISQPSMFSDDDSSDITLTDYCTDPSYSWMPCNTWHVSGDIDSNIADDWHADTIL